MNLVVAILMPGHLRCPDVPEHVPEDTLQAQAGSPITGLLQPVYLGS